MNDLVSVIVPIYNSEKYIERCIKSILSQSHNNIELILIDDGSIDSSLSICRKYSSIDDRVKIQSTENMGVSCARNLGLELANGDFIGFVDSDDYIDHRMYESMLKRIKKDNSDMAVLTKYTIKSKKQKDLNLLSDNISNTLALTYLYQLSFPTSLWAYLFVKNSISEKRLNEKIHFFEDLEFLSRILMDSKSISLCHEKAYNYIQHDESANSQPINEKRMSSLEVYNIVSKQLKDRGLYELEKYTPYFRAHFLVSILLNISKSDTNAELKYIDKVNKLSKEVNRGVLLSAIVPLSYKILIFSSMINTSFSVRLLKKTRTKKTHSR
ncbi:glycosyltransferase family 2 protein [Exiguobacterium sp. SH1S21]|uniref:glycosyltransferase family 2 protein n=1 Tax=Exiguobacterium sp. SH1S21 TaxID=2510953 RepID=UPI001038F3D0|nr:glycosyltransferase family 2 protein [Exiguobacterium sp. SH1S21]TCI57448.1 glycosyltransferase family 2 protein [Exiguobacterium sp. SH1S21]